MCRATKHGPGSLVSVYTVVKLTIVQLIVGTDLGTTEKSLEIHQIP